MPSAWENRIDFPVPDSVALVNERRSLINRDAIRNDYALTTSIPPPAIFLTAKMVMPPTSLSFFYIDVFIDGFMADRTFANSF